MPFTSISVSAIFFFPFQDLLRKSIDIAIAHQCIVFFLIVFVFR
jgi:hypothetical protein